MTTNLARVSTERTSEKAQSPLPHSLRRLFPFEHRYIQIDGYKMHYVDEGQGDVVLLIHGNPTWSFYYRGLIETLKKNFRVIAPDFLGCGLSDRTPIEKFRAEDRIRHLGEFVDKLKLEKFSLVLHDWGGAIGTGLAVRDPSKVQRIVYLNTTLTETEALPGIIKLAATPLIGKFLTKYTKRFLKLTTGLGVCRKLAKEVKEGYYFPYKNSARRTAIWHFVDDIPFDSSHPSYAQMLHLAEGISTLQHIPVQIVWGLKDPCFHREMLSKVAAHFPHANILEIPEASHLVLEDAPELTGKTIRRFLQGKTPAQVSYVSGVSKASENTLYQSFIKHAEESPTLPAAIEPLYLPDMVRYAQISHQEMRQRIAKYERGLSELGLSSGDRVLMLVPAGIEFLALSYAVMGRGAIPIFIDPGIGRDNLFQCIADINPDVFIGSAKAQLLRLKRKRIFPNLKFHLIASEIPFLGGKNLGFLKRFSAQPLPPAKGNGIAFIAFTSGATGLPKGVIFTNEMVAAQLRIFKEVLGLEAGGRDLPLLPIFSLFHLAGGICSVFPPMDPARPLSVSPERVLGLINALQIKYSFGSPTLWNKIAEYCVRSKADLGSLETILMAGAPVPPAVLQRVSEVLGKRGKAFTPYGATEALPVAVASAQEILSLEPYQAKTGEIGTYVGKPVEGLSVKVIRSVDGAIDDISQVETCAPGVIGEVIVRGPNVSPAYFERPEATMLAKIADGERFWHRMGDMGYLDESGHLYFCGRKAHIVSTDAKIFYSVPVERIFDEHPKVKRSALITLGEGRGPALAVEPHPHYFPSKPEERRVFLNELRAIASSSELTTSITEFYFHESFPVDSRHNAKIYRDRLSEWAQSLGTFDSAA